MMKFWGTDIGTPKEDKEERKMCEKTERALSKCMAEQRMKEQLCSCTVILESGAKKTIERYARDFAELYYTLLVVERVQKIISYMVIR